MNDAYDLTVRPDEDDWHDGPSTAELGLLAATCIDRIDDGCTVARSNLTVDGAGYVMILVPGQLTENTSYAVTQIDLEPTEESL